MEAVLQAPDESRLVIVDALAHGPRTAGELASLLPMARPASPAIFGFCARRGWSRFTRRGQRRIYNIRFEPLAEVDAWLSPHRALWEHRLGVAHRDSAREARTEEGIPVNKAGEGRILGTLSSRDGKAVVRMQERFDTDMDDVWSALTDPARVARWLGVVEGDLRVGGSYRYHFTASCANGTCTIEECEPPRRFLLRHALERQGVHVIEATLTTEGDQTLVVIEERGMPLDQIAAYGAGIQIHVEDLGAHLDGREPEDDVEARWNHLKTVYRSFADEVN